MAGWRVLRAVVPNFLSTFTSRYRDRDGWWLFGLAEASLDGLSVDLLALAPQPDSPLNQMICDAIRHFQDQMRKHRVASSLLTDAMLQINRGVKRKHVSGSYLRDGHDFTISVFVNTANRHHIERSIPIFVAPHDPQFEYRASGHLTSDAIAP